MLVKNHKRIQNTANLFLYGKNLVRLPYSRELIKHEVYADLKYLR